MNQPWEVNHNLNLISNLAANYLKRTSKLEVLTTFSLSLPALVPEPEPKIKPENVIFKRDIVIQYCSLMFIQYISLIKRCLDVEVESAV